MDTATTPVNDKLDILHNRTQHLTPEQREAVIHILIGYVAASVPYEVWDKGIETGLRAAHAMER